MGNKKGKFEILYNTKCKDGIEVYVPDVKNPWYVSWKKKEGERVLVQLLSEYKEEIDFP